MSRGGKRTGAGAPRKPHKKRAVLVGLPQDLLDGLAVLPGSRAALIEQACREYYGIKKPDAIDLQWAKIHHSAECVDAKGKGHELTATPQVSPSNSSELLCRRAQPEHFVCHDCGPHVAADEDGCCAGCGADCTVTDCRCRLLVEA